MSGSPQNGGFHRCTGGNPFAAGFLLAASLAAAVSPSSPCVLVCPCFALVCPEFDRLDLARLVHVTRPVSLPSSPAKNHRSGRHIVMPFIPRNPNNRGKVKLNETW